MNQIHRGDCLEILQSFPDNFVDLVYLDPPFFTQKVHALKSRDLSKAYVFEDKWDNREAYLNFLEVRLREIKRVMKATATLFFHCDRTASHYIRLLLDKIFGEQHFLSEIIWTYRRWSNESDRLQNAHQTIYMYSKTDHYKFRRIWGDYSQTTNLDQILQKRKRNAAGKAVYAADEEGNIVLNGPKTGVPLSDVWEIPFLNPKARERVGYPTQKPILLLERILEISTDEQDVVLDPFCGSGTTLVAAALLNRQYIGIDILASAVELAHNRLKNPTKSESHLMKNGKEAYDNLPDYVKNILACLPAKPVQRNAGIDAIYDTFVDGCPVVIRVQRRHELLLQAAYKLITAGRKKKAAKMFLIRTDMDSQQPLTQIPFPEEVHLIDSTELLIKGIVNQTM